MGVWSILVAGFLGFIAGDMIAGRETQKLREFYEKQEQQRQKEALTERHADDD